MGRRSGNAINAPRNTPFNPTGRRIPKSVEPESTNASAKPSFRGGIVTYLTHRAFCDVLADETAKAPAPEVQNLEARVSPAPPQPPEAAAAAQASVPEDSCSAAVASNIVHDDDNDNNHVPESLDSADTNPSCSRVLEETHNATNLAASCSGSSSSNAFATLFASSTTSSSLQLPTTGFTDLFQAIARPNIEPPSSSEPAALCLTANQGSSIFGKAGQECRQYPPPPQPALSATALLQKAAQMGAASNALLLTGLGLVSSSSSPNVAEGWNLQQKVEPDNGSGLKELMLGMGAPSVLGPEQTTLDLLGLGMAANGGSTGRLSALMSRVNGGVDGREYGNKEIRRSCELNDVSCRREG